MGEGPHRTVTSSDIPSRPPINIAHGTVRAPTPALDPLAHLYPPIRRSIRASTSKALCIHRSAHPSPRVRLKAPPPPLQPAHHPPCPARLRPHLLISTTLTVPAPLTTPGRGEMASCRLATAAVGTTLLSLVLVLQISAGAGAGAGADCYFPAVFNFGDSNSDTGGLSATFGAAPPPNGRTFFGMPVGRYCDGRLVIDFIAESLGIPYLSAYLNSIGSNFSQGANFATAGSSIRRQNTSLFLSGFSPISLDVQSWEFEQFINRSQLVYNNKGGIYREILPKAEYFSQALYTFDIGQNDITTGYFANQTTEEVIASIPDLMERLASIIHSVHWLGGRYFWIHNTGPLGCLPYALVHRPDIAARMDNAGCSITYNKVAQLFNLRLKETVARLRKTHPGAAFTYVDIYTAKYKLISEANKLGFDDPLLTCCGHGGQYNFDQKIGCGGKVQVNGTWVVVGKSCEDPSKRVSWDGVHFTEAANKYVFDQIAGGALSDPPVPLRQACQSKGQ